MSNEKMQGEWFNRKVVPIPRNAKLIRIYSREEEYLCRWFNFEPKDYPHQTPPIGLVGYAKVASGHYSGIGFNAWEQNDSEFLMYQVVEFHDTTQDDKFMVFGPGRKERKDRSHLTNKLTHMKTEKTSLTIIGLPGGKEAVNLLPNDNNRVAAVVDLEVLKRLAGLLERGSLDQIKLRFKDQIDDNATSIEAYVNIIEDELAFQKTVNLISTIQLD